MRIKRINGSSAELPISVQHCYIRNNKAFLTKSGYITKIKKELPEVAHKQQFYDMSCLNFQN